MKMQTIADCAYDIQFNEDFTECRVEIGSGWRDTAGDEWVWEGFTLTSEDLLEDKEFVALLRDAKTHEEVRMSIYDYMNTIFWQHYEETEDEGGYCFGDGALPFPFQRNPNPKTGITIHSVSDDYCTILSDKHYNSFGVFKMNTPFPMVIAQSIDDETVEDFVYTDEFISQQHVELWDTNSSKLYQRVSGDKIDISDGFIDAVYKVWEKVKED